MVRRDSFINKIRALNYSYKDQQKRTYLYRKTAAPTTSLFRWPIYSKTEYVSTTLRQAGCPDDEIKAFLAGAKS